MAKEVMSFTYYYGDGREVPHIYSDIYKMEYESTKRSVDILERKYLAHK